MNGYPVWLSKTIPTIQPYLESTISVSSEDTSDAVREAGIDKTNKKPTSEKSPVVLPYKRSVRTDQEVFQTIMMSKHTSSI